MNRRTDDWDYGLSNLGVSSTGSANVIRPGKAGLISFCHVFCGAKDMKPSAFHINFALCSFLVLHVLCVLGSSFGFSVSFSCLLVRAHALV
jgi:hypothetical protein